MGEMSKLDSGHMCFMWDEAFKRHEGRVSTKSGGLG